MAIFLNWKNSIKGAKDRFIISLFSSVSSRWYPVSIINSPSGSVLDTYDFFDVYAEEFYLVNREVNQTFLDLSLDTVRKTSVANRGSSKMYDNFGAYFETPKFEGQYFDSYDRIKGLQTYRQGLRWLHIADLEGSTTSALKNLGYAFTGVSPIIEDYHKEYDGWVLTTHTGSVLHASSNFIVSNIHIPHVGEVIYTDGDLFNEGNSFVYSYSKLGTNTVLRSKKNYNSDLKLTFFSKLQTPDEEEEGANSLTDSFLESIELNTKRLVRADIHPLINYSDKLVFHKYTPGSVVFKTLGGLTFKTLTGQIFKVIQYSSQGFLYNTTRIFPTGSVYTTEELVLPSDYQEYDWYYDWMVNEVNEGYFDVEIRTYPTSSIPSTVPYSVYSEEFPILLTPDDRGNYVHWQFQNSASLLDISGWENNLSLSVPSSFNAVEARDERKYCFKNISSFEYQGTVENLNFQESFYCEIWTKGINKQDGSDPNKFEDLSILHSDGTSDNYYNFFISEVTKTFGLGTSKDAVASESSHDITSYFNELPERFHYFAISYIPGRVFFYIDGETVKEEEIALEIPNVPTGSMYVTCNGGGIAIDEVVISEGFLDENLVKERYEAARPRIYRQGIPSGSVEQYHQARFISYAYDERETEFHQFSLRGFKSPIYKHRGRKYATIFTHPIFRV